MLVPYEDNTYLKMAKSNLTLVKLRRMDDASFATWADDFRRDVTYAWDELGVPLLGGRDGDDIVRDFQSLSDLNVSDIESVDELTGDKDCLINRNTGSSCNQFFPTMLKTLDIDAKGKDGRSIYGFFSDPDLREKFTSNLRAYLREDSIRLLYNATPEDNALDLSDIEHSLDAEDFELVLIGRPDRNAKKCRIATADEAAKFRWAMDHEDQPFYEVRYVSRKKRIYDARSIFRVIFDMRPAGNFPPVVARYLYHRFTKDIPGSDRINIYDPSSGWGGRLLGALSLYRQRKLHYVGTDPNTDHWMPDLGMTKYEYLAQYFNGNATGDQRTTLDIFRDGSEVIQHNEAFRKYRGKIDFIFTSPPYFAAEGYSQDETQSYKKFPTYTEWRNGFLTETLKTCAEWLRPGRWLCWNIADIGFNAKLVPLQQDTIDILTNLGMEYRGFLKMVLAESPGGGKTTESGVPTTRNFCKINGRTRKFEPILMFWKPADLAKTELNSICALNS